MTDTQPTLNGLAAKITELSDTLTKYLNDKNIPAPTFAADSPTGYVNLSPEIFMVRQELLDALNDMCPQHTQLFRLWSAVPVEGSASYADIAKHTSPPEDVAHRILQHAMNLRIFSETEPGKPSSRVQHTSRSAALARSGGLRALVSTILNDAGAPMMVLNEALERYTRGKPALTQEVGESSFALFHSSGIYGRYNTSWELLENDGIGEKKGWRAKNFVEFMRYVKEIFHLEDVVLESYDWKAAGKAAVVGGSAGHDAVVLARHFPDLNIIVQDLPKVRPVFEADLPSDLKSRVSFMEHDFFQPQPVQADIYVFKMILHDWPDHEAARILRALVPALKPGARVILFEYIGKQDSTTGAQLPRSFQQMGTATDLRLMALFNGKERPAHAWKQLFASADERFEIARINANPVAFFVVVEAVWRE
ncbi:uncharacterized protein PADG_01203 [Paracoccidioides brasiliensis Pb18]|uniref:O-methyltransferase C-terminal domain-containing protein n=1 Tax=Paracoccidioides brasiliensis (strain Pb18) TaxID=502780 RepID=C1G2N7_PARBD|nr:uncharacterized protein PADG_01203 [Paracoccidioides brasiliensis Pb18]EEH45053.2 hypothetical protein PADG_01203 [Paracoccidioides brasiliensis Pb18]